MKYLVDFLEEKDVKKSKIFEHLKSKKEEVVFLKEMTKQYVEGSIEVVVFEPELHEEHFFNSRVVTELKEFKEISDVIVANRLSDNIKSVKDKVVTRDLFGGDS